MTWPQPDHREIRRFLELLGKPKGTTRLRALYPSGDPRKAGDQGRKGTGSLELVERWQREGRGVYAVINDGGDTAKQITACRAVFCEWDDQPKEWQVRAWRELGLPEPTMQNDTGCKSIHSYWVLNEPMAPDAWIELQARLLEHANADRSIKDLPRVMRLPGCWYMHPGNQVGEMTRIISESGKRYDPQEIAACLPAPVPAAAPNPGPVDAAPLAQLLPCELTQLADRGAPEGSRNATAFKLAASAIAVANAAAADGLRVDGSPEAVVLAFAARCSPPLPEREALNCLRSAAGQPRAVDAGWPKRLAHHRRRQQQQAAAESKMPQSKKQSRELSPQEKISALRCLATELLLQKTPFPDRLPLLRARAEVLQLTLRDQELQRLIWDARRAAAGTIEPLSEGAVIDLSPCPWHWEGVLMADCLNLIAGLPKTGKTSLLLALIGAWRQGAPNFLGLPLIGACPPVLIVGTDQPQSDWGRMMREVGLLGDKNQILSPIVGLFHKGCPLHLDHEGIERIGAYAAKHPRLLILLDSVSACTISLGLDENSAEIVEPINDLMEAVSPHGATVLAIHHASKGRQGESATLASRGSTALPAAASQVVALAKMASPLAGPPDRRIVLKTEGRGGMPQQLLIERTEDGWISHGSAEAVAQAQALQEVEDNLNDRQAEALVVVRDRWNNGQHRTDARNLADALGLAGDGERKARSTLDQLTRRRLVHCAVEAGLQGRNKWFWPVGAEVSHGGLSDASEPSELSYPPSRARTCLDPEPKSKLCICRGSEGSEGKEGSERSPREVLPQTLDRDRVAGAGPCRAAPGAAPDAPA
jgi:hypothetical protein